jgi:hypothetical protein
VQEKGGTIGAGLNGEFYARRSKNECRNLKSVTFDIYFLANRKNNSNSNFI